MIANNLNYCKTSKGTARTNSERNSHDGNRSALSYCTIEASLPPGSQSLSGLSAQQRALERFLSAGRIPAGRRSQIIARHCTAWKGSAKTLVAAVCNLGRGSPCSRCSALEDRRPPPSNHDRRPIQTAQRPNLHPPNNSFVCARRTASRLSLSSHCLTT